MGRSSEEFIKQREGELNSLPIISTPFSWEEYFVNLGNQYRKTINEKQNI